MRKWFIRNYVRAWTSVHRLLRNEEFDPNRKYLDEGLSYLHYYAEEGNLTGLSLYKDAGSDVNQPDNLGRTPLHYAAKAGKNEAVRFLFNVGADPSARMTDGTARTPADLAREAGHLDLAESLRNRNLRPH